MLNRIKKFKRIKTILLALCYIAIYYVVSALVQSLYILWQKRKESLTLSEIEINITNGSYALSVISIIITLWIYLLINKMRRKPLGTVVKNRHMPLMVNIMAIALAVGLRMIVIVYYAFSHNVEFLKRSIDEASQISPQFTNSFQLLIGVFAIVVVSPFFEEVLFRGIVFGELRTVMRPWSANTVQAVLFGLAHAVLFQSIFAFAVGIVLGIVYYKVKSIQTVAICHGVFNLSVIFTQSEMSPQAGVLIALLGVLLSFCALYYIIQNSEKR